MPLRQIDVEAELITPTGAALAAELHEAFGLMPPLRVEKVGYGAGTREFAGRPNVLRGILGELEGETRPNQDKDTVVELQANIDDLPAEILGATQERLFQAGALDVFFTPVQMKKNRPGTLLTVLAPLAAQTVIENMVFRETSTFGIRYRTLQRRVLDRRFETCETEYGSVRIKLGLLDGELLQAAPEFDDCSRLALAQGLPLKRVYEAALRAFRRP
jgi:uncharacterized protein (DUF111 family)